MTAFSPPKACSTPFCSGHAIPGTHKCKDCTIPVPESSPIVKKYEGNQPAYRKAIWLKFRLTMKAYNSLCQRILGNGLQCTNEATIFHHLVDMKDGGGLTDPSNVVGCCAQHHPGGQRGNPENCYWSPTKWGVFNGKSVDIVIYPHASPPEKSVTYFKAWIGA
jgi:hypothetical protein